jgi:hypothetical protein
MPRLEDGEFASGASKFKKRRAWITSDEPVVTLPTIQAETEIPAAPTPLIESKTTHEQEKSETRVKHEYNKSETRLEHEYNKSETRVEHDYNKGKTRVKQKKSSLDAAISPIPPVSNLESNKSETRVKHDYNMSTTRVEHEYNKSQTMDTDSFYAFVVAQRTLLNVYDDDLRSMLLSLSDVQRRLFWHVAFECINRGDMRTAPLEIKSFFAPLGISTAVVRTSLVRLIDKRLLQREKGKLGKNGFAIIALPKTAFEIAHDLVINFQNSQK